MVISESPVPSPIKRITFFALPLSIASLTAFDRSALPAATATAVARSPTSADPAARTMRLRIWFRFPLACEQTPRVSCARCEWWVSAL